MNKKALTILVVIFELLAVVAIVFFTVDSALAMSRSETVFKINLAKDIQLMAETLVSLPGEALVEYPGNASGYIILLGQEEITVFKRGDKDSQKERKNILLPAGYQALGSFEEKASLCLEKKDKTLLLKECPAKAK